MLAGPMKLHLVDATFELFRAFYSRPPRRAPDGRPVNAVQGLIDSMLALLREPDVTHVAAATDHVIESWRNDLYPAYKSSAGVDPALLAQFDDAERALEALGMPVWPMVEDEADDAIAAAVERFGTDPRVERIVMAVAPSRGAVAPWIAYTRSQRRRRRWTHPQLSASRHEVVFSRLQQILRQRRRGGRPPARITVPCPACLFVCLRRIGAWQHRAALSDQASRTVHFERTSLQHTSWCRRADPIGRDRRWLHPGQQRHRADADAGEAGVTGSRLGPPRPAAGRAHGGDDRPGGALKGRAEPDL